MPGDDGRGRKAGWDSGARSGGVADSGWGMSEAGPETVDRLETLYRSERRGLTAAAWMILGSREAAEDAVQHAFAAVGRRGIDGLDNPAAYLRTIVVNECRRQLRQRKRVELRATLPEVGVTDDLSDLASVLDALPPRRRTAVVLRYWCDLSVNDIAEAMDCRPSTVSSLLHRSHAALRELLDADRT